jgi:hypothetical protein
VEAPGTVPGSERSIATAIYFHSQRTGRLNIGSKDGKNSARGIERWNPLIRPDFRIWLALAEPLF